jgi:putative ATP-dependent endonuclease of OLD family
VQETSADWVPNPGGGGNWKSNANSIVPRSIYVRAVHDASDETNARDASTYGKLINLIVERQLAGRPEVQQLRAALDQVMELFRPDEAHPEHQAKEIRELQRRITEGLENVIGAQALIKTEPIELRNLLLPSTSLVIRDNRIGIETEVSHQGHGLQRTLIMTLLQIAHNVRIAAGAGGAVPAAATHMLSPDDLEGVLNFQVPKSASKPYLAVKRVEELAAANALPEAFMQAVNFAYFGQITEPGAVVNRS